MFNATMVPFYQCDGTNILARIWPHEFDRMTNIGGLAGRRSHRRRRFHFGHEWEPA